MSKLLSLVFACLVVACDGYVTELGTNNYTSYQVGDAASNIIITAPHGGTIKTGLTTRRTAGCYNAADNECTYDMSCLPLDTANCDAKNEWSDHNTQHLANELADRLATRLGARPHVVRCEVHRSKLDCNRDWAEATMGIPEVNAAWYEYHQFIDTAKAAATAGGRRAFYVDLHGQNADKGWNMVGFLLSKDGKNGIKKTVIPDRLAQYSSLMQLHADSGVSMEDLVRGTNSIGAFLQNGGFDTVPSPVNKNATGGSYYTGGYDLRRHTGWEISGIQVEVHRDIRYSGTQRRSFADYLADGIQYWVNNYV